jgi:hypothetical protein
MLVVQHTDIGLVDRWRNVVGSKQNVSDHVDPRLCGITRVWQYHNLFKIFYIYCCNSNRQTLEMMALHM